MKQKLIPVVVVSMLFGVVFCVNSVAWSFEKQTPRRMSAHQFVPPPFEDRVKSGAYCEIFNDADDPSFYFDQFDSGTGFAVYMDPGQCGGSPYPFRITDVHLYLYHTGSPNWLWPVNIRVNLREPLSGDSCLGPDPQRVLHSEPFSVPVDSSYAALGRRMNLTLNFPYCLYEPFFLEIVYTDHRTPTDTLPSLLMDDIIHVPDTCDNWAIWTDFVYYEWYNFWSLPVPGNAIIRATGYTQAPECEDLWYWKPDRAHAPSGMADFDQYQFGDSMALCGPTAVANCLWWFDAVPVGMTPPDLIRLLSTYFKTDPYYVGTYVDSMQLGLERYFNDYGFALQESTFQMPHFFEMEDSLKKCQDIILLIGFWWYDDVTENWYREGGHFVTMAGVCSESLKIAIGDPARDAAEYGWPGRVRPPEHPSHPGDPFLHNDPAYVCHDMYQSILDSPFPSPGNPFWEIDYYWMRGQFSGMNVPQKLKDVTRPAPRDGKDIFTTEVEYAVMICPTSFRCGDANGDGVIDPADVVFLINYLFRNGPDPDPYEVGDCNGDGVVDPADVVYLINYLFRNGPPPDC